MKYEDIRGVKDISPDMARIIAMKTRFLLTSRHPMTSLTKKDSVKSIKKMDVLV